MSEKFAYKEIKRQIEEYPESFDFNTRAVEQAFKDKRIDDKQRVELLALLSAGRKNAGPDFQNDVLSKLKEAVYLAGKTLMERFNRTDLRVFTKAGAEVSIEKAKKEISSNFTTEADLASHKMIVSVVGEREYKGVPIIFEEADWTQTRNGTYISFDEMDGTGSFMKGKPGFMVLSQYVERGTPTVSANFDPVNGNLFYSIKGQGSYQDGRRLFLSPAADISNARIIINGRDKERPENKAYWDFMYAGFGERLSAGLATGSRMASILKGDVDAFVNFGSEELHIWDFGMVLNIIEAGGVATRKDGSKLDFEKNGILKDLVCAANTKLHSQLIEYLKKFK